MIVKKFRCKKTDVPDPPVIERKKKPEDLTGVLFSDEVVWRSSSIIAGCQK